MPKLYVVTTLSGSIYKIFDSDKEKWLERIPSQEASILRKDEERIRLYQIIRLTLGKSAVFALEPLGLGNITVRATTIVVDIKIINN